MNVSYKEKLASLPEEQARLKERSKKRAASKRSKKARTRAAQLKYYRKNHPIVQRSRKRARQRKEVATLLKIVKQSVKHWEQDDANKVNDIFA